MPPPAKAHGMGGNLVSIWALPTDHQNCVTGRAGLNTECCAKPIALDGCPVPTVYRLSHDSIFSTSRFSRNS